MSADETAELFEQAQALILWEKVLEQQRDSHVSDTATAWLDNRIRLTRKAALAVQVQLHRERLVTRPHVVSTASSYRDDPLAIEASEQWTEAESREAWGK